MRNYPAAIAAAGAVLRYTTENLRKEAGYITDLEFRIFDDALQLDAATVRHLELIESRGEHTRAGCRTLLGGDDAAFTVDVESFGRGRDERVRRGTDRHNDCIDIQDEFETL